MAPRATATQREVRELSLLLFFSVRNVPESRTLCKAILSKGALPAPHRGSTPCPAPTSTLVLTRCGPECRLGTSESSALRHPITNADPTAIRTTTATEIEVGWGSRFQAHPLTRDPNHSHNSLSRRVPFTASTIFRRHDSPVLFFRRSSFLLSLSGATSQPTGSLLHRRGLWQEARSACTPGAEHVPRFSTRHRQEPPLAGNPKWPAPVGLEVDRGVRRTRRLWRSKRVTNEGLLSLLTASQ